MQDISRFIIIQIIKQRYHILYKNSSYKYNKSLYILPLAAMVLLNGFISYNHHPYGDIFVILGSLMLVVSNITVFSVIEKLLHAQDIIKDNEMLVLQTNLEKQYFQRIEEINEEYAGYIHDMRHVLRIIGCLAETENNEEIKQISLQAGELLKVKSPLDRIKYIEDTIVDAIINEREKAAKEKGIHFSANIIKETNISFLSDLDKIRIFGNLLDNALEASASCEDGYITLDLRNGNDFMIILHIVNNFKNENKKKEKTYQIIHEDNIRHGFGIKNVKEIVKKYNGIVKISEEENTFSITLILSSVQNSEKS